MALVWSRNYESGLADIDSQHRQLFNHLNSAMEAVAAHNDSTTVNRVLAFLEDYVNIHFSTEESYMKQYAYPEAEEHANQHQEFRILLAGLKRDIHEDGTILMNQVRLNRILCDWWIHHINDSDKKMTRFVVKQMLPNASPR